MIRNARPSPPVQNGFFSWTFNLLMWPIRWPVSFAFRTFAGIFQFVASIFGFGASNHTSRPVQFWPSTTPFDPRADVENFVADFETKYGLMHPQFFVGSYSQVLERAKSELQFLLVYLQSPGHADTNRFCGTTLTSPELVKEHLSQNIIFSIIVGYLYCTHSPVWPKMENLDCKSRSFHFYFNNNCSNLLTDIKLNAHVTPSPFKICGHWRTSNFFKLNFVCSG